MYIPNNGQCKHCRTSAFYHLASVSLEKELQLYRQPSSRLVGDIVHYNFPAKRRCVSDTGLVLHKGVLYIYIYLPSLVYTIKKLLFSSYSTYHVP